MNGFTLAANGIPLLIALAAFGYWKRISLLQIARGWYKVLLELWSKVVEGLTRERGRGARVQSASDAVAHGYRPCGIIDSAPADSGLYYDKTSIRGWESYRINFTAGSAAARRHMTSPVYTAVAMVMPRFSPATIAIKEDGTCTIDPKTVKVAGEQSIEPLRQS